MTKLAIVGGEKTREAAYPAWPPHDERDIQALAEVLRSGNWGGFPYPGAQTRRFLEAFIALQGGQHAVAMMNGTLTMEVALRAADIGWGDEVIVPAYTFQATAAAPMMAGAVPVLVDIDPHTFCIDPAMIEAAITPRTRAIIPVHVAAQMADMDAINRIAARHDLVVIEDAAHAHGAVWNGRGAGTLGDFGSFSMQSTKILTAGEGGVLLCQSEEQAWRAASIIDCGRPHDPAAELFTQGGNYRMTELQAALLNVGLERFPAQFAMREALAASMDEALSELPGIQVLPRDGRHQRRAVYGYTFAIEPDDFGATNDLAARALTAEGIPCWSGYEPMHRCELFQPTQSRLPVPSAFPERFDYSRLRLPVAERVSSETGMWLGEAVFRAGEQGVDDAVAALGKIQSALARDPGLAERIAAQ
ncbi:MAG: DegT/DnrJ/EryC1/StrS family aminotransferase [Chloroflexi bacterium]|nr:DegT/DnrJ/EryC1/StrS family aminotransferase [Chloroflexota bacterium]MCY4248364.1 DegT/DnrJ/EryC1/StrS family aminotransferase [Chloroflexota bacterium]